MKKNTPTARRVRSERAGEAKGAAAQGRIHPVIIYPFKQPDQNSDLEALYSLIARLDEQKGTYARPITVIDRKTHYSREKDLRYHGFRNNTIAKHSEIVDTWGVDTCQMWYSGLGLAYERGQPGDVYWLIPGDFNYGTPSGQEVLGGLHDLPEIIVELQQDICIGEIAADHASSKQLIDTYGTFALLYNWFPREAQEIRAFTERPRSEFFAIHHAFLGEALRERWYAYEQTMVLLLKAVLRNKKISRFFVGHISDLPEGRESFSSALQQVERAERVLKSLWREKNESAPGWAEQYRLLEAQSEQIRRTATLILRNLLE